MNFFSKHSPRIFLVILVFFTIVSTLRAIHPQRIVLDSYNDFAQGISESVEIKAEGSLVPSPYIEKIASLPAEQAWSILAEGMDGCLVGTSPEGKLFRIQKNSTYQLVAKFPEGNISALAMNNKGEIFVGTSPDGKIYKIKQNGQFEVFFDPKEKYIWSIICDNKSNMYVGTGTGGRIYRLTPDGKAEVYATLNETHVRCLLFYSEGTLLAGTANRGAIYKIFPGGKSVLFVDPEKEEINSLVAADNGTVYFSAVGKKKPSRIQNPLPQDNPQFFPEGSWMEGGGEMEEAKEYPSSKTLPLVTIKPTIPPRLSEIWKIEKNGVPYPIWSSKDFVFNILWFQNRLLIGSDSGGYVYSIDSNGKMDKLLKTGSNQNNAFALSGRQLFIAASNPVHIYLMEEKQREREAVYRSWPIDAGSMAKWGSIKVEKEGNVEVLTRTGNTHRTEAGWYDWQPLVADHCVSPRGRFLQFELRLGKNAKVSRVEIACLPDNIPPKIELLKILPSGISYTGLTMPPPPPPTKTLDQLLSHDEKLSDFESQGMPARFQLKESRGLRTVVWKAIDPDGDNIKYSIYFRPQSSGQWTLLVKDLEESLFSWDTTGWPDGFYVLKIEASDEKDNPLGMGLTSTLESRPFFVDNTPPKIRILNKSTSGVNITVSDEGSGLKTVEISEDGKNFTSLYPKEGMLDFQKEEFFIPLSAEKKILFIRAEDESGNISNALISNH